MRKLVLLPIAILFSLTAHGQSNNDEPEMLGQWRIFVSDNDVTAVLRSKDNSADMDLYCDKAHFEVSVYLKKQPEEGDLTDFAVSIDNNNVTDKSWQTNAKVRSTTVKTLNSTFINMLPGQKEIVFSYSFNHQPKTNVAFDLTEVDRVIERANKVCKLDLS